MGTLNDVEADDNLVVPSAVEGSEKDGRSFCVNRQCARDQYACKP